MRVNQWMLMSISLLGNGACGKKKFVCKHVDRATERKEQGVVTGLPTLPIIPPHPVALHRVKAICGLPSFGPAVLHSPRQATFNYLTLSARQASQSFFVWLRP